LFFKRGNVEPPSLCLALLVLKSCESQKHINEKEERKGTGNDSLVFLAALMLLVKVSS